jgi:hypothetical protein
MVNRITYTGDLGYEIWMEPAYQRQVYDGIKQAGAEFGIVDFGMRALLSMRLEKNFPTWFRELRPIYGPFEGAMDRFVKLDKNDFIGREAAAKEQADGPKLRRVSFVVDAADADVMGDEPIWAKVGDTDYGTVEPPHGYGAPRFDADGKEIAKTEDGTMRDGDWRVVGWVTSGGYAHTSAHRWRRATCRLNWQRMARKACSRSKSSASAARRASRSNRRSIPRARRCGANGEPRIRKIGFTNRRSGTNTICPDLGIHPYSPKPGEITEWIPGSGPWDDEPRGRKAPRAWKSGTRLRSPPRDHTQKHPRSQ